MPGLPRSARSRASSLVVAIAVAASCAGDPASSGGGPGSPIPAPDLTDPSAIGEALWDPARVGVGISSILAELGVSIVDGAGETRRPGHGRLAQVRLSEAEVRGLVAMAAEDAAAILDGRAPFTMRTLTAALAGVMPGLTEEEILDAYLDAYAAAPGDLVGGSLAGRELRRSTPLTRAHLWLLLVDGVLGRDPATAAVRIASAAGALPIASTPVADVELPTVVSPLADLTGVEAALGLVHLPVVGYDLALEFSIAPGTAHEGHGGPGPDVVLELRNQGGAVPVIGPLSGTPILLPRAGLDGLVATFRSGDEALFEAHGAFSTPLAASVTTDALGVARSSYRVRQEPSTEQGDVASATGIVSAVVDLRTLVMTQYLVAHPAALAFVWGERVLPAALELEWHEPPVAASGGFHVVLTGPWAGAGEYAGQADVLCVETPSEAGTSWTVVAAARTGEISMIDLHQDPAGAHTISVQVRSQAELGPWFASSAGIGQTASITVDRNGPLAVFSGIGSWTDTTGTRFTIEVQVACTPL